LDPKPPRLHLPLDDATRAQLAGWVREHWDSVFGHLYRLSGKRHVAEDLTQETFLRAGQQFRSFKAGSNLRAWLMRIATNAFLDSRRRAGVAKSDSIPDEAAAPAPTMSMADARELNQALADALAELPETARAVFLLRAREEMSFREIAEAIGSTEETARWHMLQARRKLMQRMNGWL
jgi:RNA polymerase sigma-70 factor (ECF subfamily)